MVEWISQGLQTNIMERNTVFRESCPEIWDYKEPHGESTTEGESMYVQIKH